MQYPSIVDALENATTYHGLTLTETTSLADGILLEPLTDRLSTMLTNVDEHVGSNRSEQEYGSYPWRGALQQDDPRCRASSASSSLVFATQREAWNMQASPFANSSRFPCAYGSSSQYLAGYCPPFDVDIPRTDDSVGGIFSPRAPYNALTLMSSTSYGALNYPSLLPASLAPQRHSPTPSGVCANNTLAFGCAVNSIENVDPTDSSYCLGVEEIEALRKLPFPPSSSSLAYSADRVSFFPDPERSLLASHPGADVPTFNNQGDSGAWWQRDYGNSLFVYPEADFNLGPGQCGAETLSQNVEPYEDGHSNVRNTVMRLAPETVNDSIPAGLDMRQTVLVNPALDAGPLWIPAFVADTMVNVVPESSQLSVPSGNSASERSQWATCPGEDRMPATQVDDAAGNSALKVKKEDKESGKADGKQPFRCLAQNPCGKRFGRVEEARRHFRTARVHADERREHSAGQRSASEGARNDAERPFKCERERCDRAYSRRDGLQRHYRRHHRDGEEVQGMRDGGK